MPRTRALIQRNTLPSGYRNMTPSNGYPIHSDIRSKDKLTFLCDVCGNEMLWSYDNIKASPKRHDVCQVCHKAKRMFEMLQATNKDIDTGYYYLDKKSKYYHSDHRSFSIIYRLKCRNSFHNEYFVDGIRVEQFVYNNKFKSAINCPQCNKEKLAQRQRKIDDNHKSIANEIVRTIKKSFPSWSIHFIGQEKLNNNSSPPLRTYTLTIPLAINQTLESYDVLITELPLVENRIRLPMYVNSKVSEIKLTKIFNQTLNDAAKLKTVMEEAKMCGAKVLKIFAEPNNQIKVQYSNILNANSNIVTIKRAYENAWGRKGLMQGEAFILVCLKLMFPHISDWRANRRDLFPGKNYEIDISSESLKLCVEYQGDDSHRINKNTMSRDEYKIKHCPWTLIVIDKMKSYSCKNVKDACESALTKSHVKEHHIWNKFDKNNIEKEFNAVFPELVKKTANQLKKAMLKANFNHIILSPEEKILRSGKYDYKCGICCAVITNASVKMHIDRAPKGCKRCRTNQLLIK